MTIPRQLCSKRGRLAGVLGGIHPAALLAIAASMGCASAPPTEEEIAYAQAMSPTIELATTRTEELALERAASLPVGEPAELDGEMVVAGPIYPAASGRRCRGMTFGSGQRLACEDPEADVWVFVPDVFAAGRTTSGGEAPSSRAPAPQGSESESSAEGSS